MPSQGGSRVLNASCQGVGVLLTFNLDFQRGRKDPLSGAAGQSDLQSQSPAGHWAAAGPADAAGWWRPALSWPGRAVSARMHMRRQRAGCLPRPQARTPLVGWWVAQSPVRVNKHRVSSQCCALACAPAVCGAGRLSGAPGRGLSSRNVNLNPRSEDGGGCPSQAPGSGSVRALVLCVRPGPPAEALSRHSSVSGTSLHTQHLLMGRRILASRCGALQASGLPRCEPPVPRGCPGVGG